MVACLSTVYLHGGIGGSLCDQALVVSAGSSTALDVSENGRSQLDLPFSLPTAQSIKNIQVLYLNVSQPMCTACIEWKDPKISHIR